MSPDLEWEARFGYPRSFVIGVDEVGRGPLAGPVVAGAVALPLSGQHPDWVSEIDDSKAMIPSRREKLSALIRDWTPAWAIGVVSVEEIDKINIYHASHLAMVRAVEGLLAKKSDITVSQVLIDGNVIPKGMPFAATAVVKGDSKSVSIAAASIIAKVWRDAEMIRLDALYPGYGFAAHKGYSTPAHLKILREKGPCPIHRRSFAPVVQALASV